MGTASSGDRAIERLPGTVVLRTSWQEAEMVRHSAPSACLIPQQPRSVL